MAEYYHRLLNLREVAGNGRLLHVPLAPRVARVRFRYYIDPTTNEPHIYNHDVSESEVEEVLANPGEDFAAADGARLAIGQALAGGFLRVIYVPDGGDVFVITAYDLGNRALWAYRRRRRRKR